jgi:hypothetical protein
VTIDQLSGGKNHKTLPKINNGEESQRDGGYSNITISEGEYRLTSTREVMHDTKDVDLPKTRN